MSGVIGAIGITSDGLHGVAYLRNELNVPIETNHFQVCIYNGGTGVTCQLLQGDFIPANVDAIAGLVGLTGGQIAITPAGDSSTVCDFVAVSSEASSLMSTAVSAGEWSADPPRYIGGTPSTKAWLDTDNNAATRWRQATLCSPRSLDTYWGGGGGVRPAYSVVLGATCP
ncbi:MAG: hypothetical protein IPK60_10375 [Sandaracinaceae bacterium]|nr:hypothetical protein [Sandaracinaceae bacterium]